MALDEMKLKSMINAYQHDEWNINCYTMINRNIEFELDPYIALNVL